MDRGKYVEFYDKKAAKWSNRVARALVTLLLKNDTLKWRNAVNVKQFSGTKYTMEASLDTNARKPQVVEL